MRDIRSLALDGIARIDMALMREFLADPGIRPEVADCTWIMNVPAGPDPDGFTAVNAAVSIYGEENVTTGNANPCAPRQVGIYVRRGA